MPLSHAEAKQRLNRLIFNQDQPQDWTQDVWDMSPTLGETAAKLSEAFEALVEHSSAATLEELLQIYDAASAEAD